jgi:hypothetical protein
MEFTFNDVVEATYRIDLFIVNNKQELTIMQTRLNQWITAKTLVKYKTTVITDTELLFEVIRIKERE